MIELLENLSEESIYQLMVSVGKQARRVSALRKAGKESGDLETLLSLVETLTGVYCSKLLDELPEGEAR